MRHAQLVQYPTLADQSLDPPATLLFFWSSLLPPTRTSAVPFSTLAKGSQFTFESAPPGFDEMQGGGENMGGGWNLPDAIGGNRAAMVVASSGSEAQTDNRSSNIDMSSMFERPMVPSVDSDGRGGMSKEEFVVWYPLPFATQCSDDGVGVGPSAATRFPLLGRETFASSWRLLCK